MEIKDLGNISSKELRLFYAQLHNVLQEKTDFQNLIKTDQEGFAHLQKHLTTWADFYEMPFPNFILFFFNYIGMLDQIKKVLLGKQPVDSIIQWMETNPESDIDPDNISDEEKGIIFSMFIALTKDIEAILRYSVSMHDLIRQTKENDDKALFQAITIDRMVLTCPTAANRIAEAEFSSDKKFFLSLSNAINGHKPRRPKPELDEVRYLLAVLEETKSLAKISHEKLFDVLVNDLQVYSDAGKDPFEGLKKLIQRRK